MLQLDELLRQDINLSPGDKGKPSSPTLPPPKTWHQAWLAAKNTIRGRPGKNVSLFLVSGRISAETFIPMLTVHSSSLPLQLHCTLRRLHPLHRPNPLLLLRGLRYARPRR